MLPENAEKSPLNFLIHVVTIGPFSDPGVLGDSDVLAGMLTISQTFEAESDSGQSCSTAEFFCINISFCFKLTEYTE